MLNYKGTTVDIMLYHTSFERSYLSLSNAIVHIKFR